LEDIDGVSPHEFTVIEVEADHAATASGIENIDQITVLIDRIRLAANRYNSIERALRNRRDVCAI